MDIDIDIKDERHFTDVASVVDRDDFAKEIERIRSILGIKVPLKDENFTSPINKPEEKQIEVEIEKSRKHLYLPVVFRKVIEAVVFYNQVSEDDYIPACLDRKSNGTFDKEGATPDDTYLIVLSPGARDKDVLKAYQEFRDQLGNTKKGIEEYIHQVWDISTGKPSIKKHRKWYLANKSGKSFDKIADSETLACPITSMHEVGKSKPKGCTCPNVSTIRKGIEAYEALVWKTRTF